MLKKYEHLKREKKDIIYLFKHGIFFIAFNEDAKYLNKELHLKITNHNKNNIKVGFPVKSIDKYTKFIKLLNKEYKIIYNTEDYIINEITNLDINNITKEKAYDLLIKLNKMISDEKGK